MNQLFFRNLEQVLTMLFSWLQTKEKYIKKKLKKEEEKTGVYKTVMQD